jgi:hypothetical protein
MFATAIIVAGLATVNMPYAGNLNLTVTGSIAGAPTVIINNPFVTATSRFVLRGPDTNATLTFTNPGMLTLTLTGSIDGVYIISVGARNDRRSNGFSK